MTNDRHNFPEVVASGGVGDNYFREVVPIMGCRERGPIMGAWARIG
jgi:hypothetical protein